MSTENEHFLFPYDKIRKGQDAFIRIARDIIRSGRHLMVHAPTGIGKTVAALVPALQYVLESNRKEGKNKKRIVFVTPRHQQHRIVMDTIKAINKKWDIRVNVVDFIGKQKMCNMDVALLSSSDFNSFCSFAKESGSCEFYRNTYTKDRKLTTKAKLFLKEISGEVLYGDELKERAYFLCPYELTVELSKSAEVIVADYYHIFHPSVRENFLKRIGATLADVILIVDEAHNLPSRARSLFSSKTSSYQMMKVEEELKEIDKNLANKIHSIRTTLLKKFREKTNMRSGEFLFSKKELVEVIQDNSDYFELMDRLRASSDIVYMKKQRSFSSSLASFLELWTTDDPSFVRLVSVNEKGFTISLECLDPSMITKDVFEGIYASISMSATLIPLEMYEEILSVPSPAKLQLKSPFPKENKISVIVDSVTTKYDMRNTKEYEKIANEILRLINLIPGNVGVFFPSYQLRDEILRLIHDKIQKEVFVEIQNATTEEKRAMLDKFASIAEDKGGVLMAVVGANFSEGVDFKGGMMNGVIIVGLPLERPDLLTKSLIDYYQKKFGKGWEYGYIYPAMNKTVQTMGRCIRTEEDKGVIVLMDKRYKERRYRNLIPSDYDLLEPYDIEEKIMCLFKDYKLSKGQTILF